MERAVAMRLGRIDEDFYRTQAPSFSSTRQAPWPGWGRCVDVAAACAASLDVLDVACGNLRLARHLADARPGLRVSYLGIDSCPALLPEWRAPEGWTLRFRREDVVGELLRKDAGCPSSWGRHGLVTCFGFLHHVPTHDARVRLLAWLVRATAPGGVCCVSLWRFAEERGIARRARRSTEEALADLGLSAADLDRGDYLMGWQNRPHVWRYCHAFDDAETDRLVEALAGVATVEDRFEADGRSGRLNGYLVLSPVAPVPQA